MAKILFCELQNQVLATFIPFKSLFWHICSLLTFPGIMLYLAWGEKPQAKQNSNLISHFQALGDFKSKKCLPPAPTKIIFWSFWAQVAFWLRQVFFLAVCATFYTLFCTKCCLIKWIFLSLSIKAKSDSWFESNTQFVHALTTSLSSISLGVVQERRDGGEV